MLEPQQAAGAQLVGAGEAVFGVDGLLAHAVLLGHVENPFAGLQHVVFHRAHVALGLQEVGPAGNGGIKTCELVVLQKIPQPLVGAAGQVGQGFAGQGHQSAQVVDAHFGRVGRHGGQAQQLALALQALVGHQAGGLRDVAHRHNKGVGLVGGHGGGQQPVVVRGQRGRVHVQREGLVVERLPGHGRKLLEAQRRPGVLAAVGLEGQLVGQEHQHVGRGRFRHGHLGGVGVGGQRIGAHAGRAQVVAQQGVQPVVQHGVVALQVAGGGAGAGGQVLALVHGGVHGQAQAGGSFLLQLPVAHGLVDAAGIALQSAFLQGQVAEIERHAFFLQNAVDDGKRGIGQIDAGLKRGLVAAQAVGPLLHQPPGFVGEHEVQAGHVEGGGHRAGGRGRARGLGGGRAGQGRHQEQKGSGISHELGPGRTANAAATSPEATKNLISGRKCGGLPARSAPPAVSWNLFLFFVKIGSKNCSR